MAIEEDKSAEALGESVLSEERSGGLHTSMEVEEAADKASSLLCCRARAASAHPVSDFQKYYTLLLSSVVCLV